MQTSCQQTQTLFNNVNNYCSKIVRTQCRLSPLFSTLKHQISKKNRITCVHYKKVTAAVQSNLQHHQHHHGFQHNCQKHPHHLQSVLTNLYYSALVISLRYSTNHHHAIIIVTEQISLLCMRRTRGLPSPC